MAKRWAEVLLALSLGAAGCGGGAKYHVSDRALAEASVQEKQGILTAQDEKAVAESERSKAKADLEVVESELAVAENDDKAARLQLDTAKLNQKSAQQSGDMNQRPQAASAVHLAQLGVKAADAKVEWLQKKRKWIKAQRDAADDHWTATDAKVELEKAKLAQQKGIKPSADFDVMNFESENLKRQQKYTESRMDADKLQVDVDRLERSYETEKASYEGAKSSSSH